MWWYGYGPFGDGRLPDPPSEEEYLAIKAERAAMRRAVASWFGRWWAWFVVAALLAGVVLWVVT